MSGATDAVVSPIVGGGFTPTDTHPQWQIQDVRVVADIVPLDSGLQNSFTEHILAGKSLPINCGIYITILQSCSFPAINISVARAVSRLKMVFLILA